MYILYILMFIMVYSEQVNLLWQRAISDPGFNRTFCHVHAEKLSYQICDKAVETLKELAQGKQGERFDKTTIYLAI